MQRGLRITAVVLGVFLGLWFLLAGSQKFVAVEFNHRLFASLGLPVILVPLIGGLELVAALLVMVPRTSLYGAVTILSIMISAIALHLFAGLAPPFAAILAAAISGSLTLIRLRGRLDAPAS